MTLTLAQIDEAIDALLANATSLTEEARLLLDAERYPRAFALAHLAREEMSKSVMLHSTAIRLLAEHEVDWKRLMHRLRDHRSKLKLEIVENVLLLKGLGVARPEIDHLLAGLRHAADFRNDQKNDSLYVGFIDGKCVSPFSLVSESKASRNVMLAELRLQQLKFERSKMPRYAERQIGSLKGMRNYDEMKPEDFKQHIEQWAKLTAALALFREAKEGQA